MEPNEAFFKSCGGRNQRFIVELRLIKNMVHLKRKHPEEAVSQSTSQDVPGSSPPTEPFTPTPTSGGPGTAIFSNGDEEDQDSPPLKRARVAPKIVPKSVKHYMEQQKSQHQQFASPSSPNRTASSSSLSMTPPGTPLSQSQAQSSQSSDDKLVVSNNSSTSTPPLTPSVPVSSPTPKLEFEDLLHSENDRYFVLRTTDNDEFREFVENDVPVITYTFTEDLVTGKWLLNLIWPTEKRPLSWRGKFCFHLSIFRRDGFHVYNHIMSKMSSQFSIFSKPDVYLKKIRNSSSKSPNVSPSPVKSTRQSTSVASKRNRSQSEVLSSGHIENTLFLPGADLKSLQAALAMPMPMSFPMLPPFNMSILGGSTPLNLMPPLNSQEMNRVSPSSQQSQSESSTSSAPEGGSENTSNSQQQTQWKPKEE